MRIATRLIAGIALTLAATGLAAKTPSEPGAHNPATASTSLAEGKGFFTFTNWAGPALPVWTYVPPQVDPTTAPILFVMHGAKRDPRRYLGEWIDEAQIGGFVIVAPEFSRADFRGSRNYNLGAMFERGNATPRDRSLWSFSAIEPIFDDIVARLGGTQTHYTLFGHSAGSQFVHRFLFLNPAARAKRVMAANAGWYTFADREIAYPHGLKGLPVSEDDLRTVLAKDVVILLGDQDSDPNHESLNRTEGSMRQGPHRFARGQSFYREAKAMAATKGWDFNWSMRTIPGVAHSNGGIAAGSYDLVE